MKRKLREYKDATVSKASTLAGMLVIGGIILTIVATGFLILVSADPTSHYEDENEKLDAYAKELYAALSQGVDESGARELRESDGDETDVDVKLSEYVFVGAYLEAYKNDIDVEELDQPHKVFYNDSLRGLVVFDNLYKAAEEANYEAFERASKNEEGEGYLKLYEEYTNVDGEPGKPKAVDSFREE